MKVCTSHPIVPIDFSASAGQLVYQTAWQEIARAPDND